MADTDGDGTPNIDELGGVAPTEVIDLDELITLSSRGAITGTNTERFCLTNMFPIQ